MGLPPCGIAGCLVREFMEFLGGRRLPKFFKGAVAGLSDFVPFHIPGPEVVAGKGEDATAVNHMDLDAFPFLDGPTAAGAGHRVIGPGVVGLIGVILDVLADFRDFDVLFHCVCVKRLLSLFVVANIQRFFGLCKLFSHNRTNKFF